MIAAQTVTEITAYLRDLLDSDPTLSEVWITGEVSNMRRAESGHWYFTLKDSGAQLKCVMWKSAASRQMVTPKDGDALEVHGKVGVYEPRGEYQLYADLVRPVGFGDLYQQFERLKARLAAEGLFDKDRKRETPLFPLQIGVVTSPTAAAFQDIQNVLRRRFPLAEILLSPTPVQGIDAPPQIVAALERLNDFTEVDVILMIRGGGSIEDLWPFNDEQVARAVAASRIPVITGVGHEIDFTIVDFVSDVRAPTPSAAAELATPDVSDLRIALGRMTEKLIGLAYDAVLSRQEQIGALQRTIEFLSPRNQIRTRRQRIDDLMGRIAAGQRAQITLRRERLSARRSALIAANPEALLERGYAIVTRGKDGRRVTSRDAVAVGEPIRIKVRDGEIPARVEDSEANRYTQRTLF